MKTLWLWRIRTFPNYLCIALQRPQLGPPVPGGGGGGGRWGWLAGSTPKLWWGCSALVLHRLPWIWQKTLNFSTLFMTMYVILHPCIWKTPCLWNKTRIRSSQIIKKGCPVYDKEDERPYPVQRIIPIYLTYGGTPQATGTWGLSANQKPILESDLSMQTSSSSSSLFMHSYKHQVLSKNK